MIFKEEKGIIYYKDDPENSKWSIAGRKGHILTDRFIKLLKGEFDETCSVCKGCSERNI